MGQEYLRQVTSQRDINFLSNTIFFDDFEDSTFRWDSGGTGTETVGQLATDAFNGGACAQIKTRTLTPTAGDDAYMRCYPALRGYGLHEISMLINIQDAGVLDTLTIQWDVDDAITLHTLLLQFSTTTNIWTYKNDAGSQVAITGIMTPLTATKRWMILRFSWNIALNLLKAYQAAWDVSDPISLSTFTDTTGDVESSIFTITVIEMGNTTAAEARVDDVLIRQIS